MEEKGLSENLTDKNKIISSISTISPFVYELLPLPVKFIISEKQFVSFLSNKSELLVNALMKDDSQEKSDEEK